MFKIIAIATGALIRSFRAPDTELTFRGMAGAANCPPPAGPASGGNTLTFNRITMLTAAIASTAIFSAGLGGIASASDHTRSTTASTAAALTDAVSTGAPAEEQGLIDALSVVEAMPDAVVAEGDHAVQTYLAQHLPKPGSVRAFGWWQTTKCVASITVAVAGAAVPASKILKLKAFIKKAGSVKEAAYLLIRVAKGEEKISELGATLGGLAGAILGIDSIKKQCR